MHTDPIRLFPGADGFPSVRNAGNVLRPETTFKLSFRLPPSADPKLAAARLKEVLEAEPPYGAKVEFALDTPAAGWDAPPLAQWLESSLEEASLNFFGKPACYMGEGVKQDEAKRRREEEDQAKPEVTAEEILQQVVEEPVEPPPEDDEEGEDHEDEDAKGGVR